MAILPVPSRHLAGIAPQIMSLGGVGVAIERKTPHPIRQWAFQHGGMGQSQSDIDMQNLYSSDPTSVYGDVFGGPPNASSLPVDWTGEGISNSNPFGPVTCDAIGAANGLCFDTSSPTGISNPSNWANLIAAGISTAGRVATIATAPVGTYISPTGAVTIGGMSFNPMTLLMLGGGLILVLALAGGKH